MKKVYKTPVMEDLGDVMQMTKGTEGFGFQDLLRIIRGDADISDFDSIINIIQNPAS